MGNPQENRGKGPQPRKGPKRTGVDRRTGRIQAADPRRISGWAWDPKRPDVPVDVDIIVGEKVVATVKADQFGEGLQKLGKGNGMHRFVFEFPVALAAEAQSSLHVRISGTDIELDRAKRISEPPKPSPKRITGRVQRANAKQIAGWAWDPSHPDVPLEVEIYDGENLLATVKADQFVDRLLERGMGNGKHRFTYAIPPNLMDGKEHTFKLKISGTNIELKNSPTTVKLRGH